jgi:hypothetical protein
MDLPGAGESSCNQSLTIFSISFSAGVMTAAKRASLVCTPRWPISCAIRPDGSAMRWALIPAPPSRETRQKCLQSIIHLKLEKNKLVTATSRQSYSQNRTVLHRALLCVNQWEEDKYVSLFRYIQMSL